MTFEDVKARIDSGAIESLDDVAEMLRTLAAAQQRSGVYIALALYESRRLFKGARWSAWAAKEYRMADEKDALHRANVGEMLRTIEQDAPKLHARFMDQGITLLRLWAVLYNEGKRLMAADKIDSALIPLRNFLKAHPDAFDWKRDDLDRKIKLFLNPDAEDMVQPDLNLTFDAIGSALDDDDLRKITGREDFDGETAYIMADNGAKLCTHAIDVILQDNDTLPVDMLENIDRKLEDTHRKLRALLIHKRG